MEYWLLSLASFVIGSGYAFVLLMSIKNEYDNWECHGKKKK